MSELAEALDEALRLAGLAPHGKPPGVVQASPSSPQQLSFELIKEVFPEAEILGPDNTNWEAIKRRCEEFEAARPGWIEAAEQRRKVADEARNHPAVQAWLRHWQGEIKYDPECGLTPEQWEEFKQRGIATPLPEPLYRKRKGTGV